LHIIEGKLDLLVLLFETFLILTVFNASSYFGTTTYSKAIDYVGVALTALLLLWVLVSCRFHFGYSTKDLGLTVSSVSRRQWVLVFATMSIFYLIAFVVEIVSPSEIKGEVTLARLFSVAAFTLTFGPIFEELLFRGYLFKRSKEVLKSRVGSDVLASFFSGLAFGFWHYPSPILLFYFNDPIIKVYENLSMFVLAASAVGVILGEIRRRTRSILPGALLHFCGNSMYVIAMALKIF